MELKRLRLFLTQLFLFVLIPCSLFSQRLSREDYIKKYSSSAVNQMHKYKIPASITLAQGILESGNGNSRLATKANNHFGIKCHGWKGEKIYADDDKKHECFRSYKNTEESFRDHSQFLIENRRYSFLFEYKITDYKSWAKGLKKAGYATSNKYAESLIDIIEKNNLDQYDKIKPSESIVYANNNPKRNIYLHPNKIKYVWSEKDESFLDISKELGLGLWELYKYNDIAKNYELIEGERIFIQPKRNKAKTESHIIQEGETLWSISQQYGIKLRKLKKKNKHLLEVELKSGFEIKLQ